MIDIYAFEYDFFKLVSESFPVLKTLVIKNDQPQKEKRPSTTRIAFPHLIVLYIAHAHVDYAEQFLFDDYCHLPRLLDLSISYRSLKLWLRTTSPMMQHESLAVD